MKMGRLWKLLISGLRDFVICLARNIEQKSPNLKILNQPSAMNTSDISQIHVLNKKIINRIIWLNINC